MDMTGPTFNTNVDLSLKQLGVCLTVCLLALYRVSTCLFSYDVFFGPLALETASK